MAFAFIQSVRGTGTTSATSGAITTTKGNLLLVAAFSSTQTLNQITGLTDNKGNTFIKAKSFVVTAAGDAELWYANSIAGGASHTVTGTAAAGQTLSLVVQEFSGPNVGVVFDTPSAGSSQTGTSGDVANLNTRIGGELVVAIGMAGSTAVSMSAGAGWSNKDGAQNNYFFALESQIVANAGTVSGTGAYTLGGTVANGGFLAAFLPGRNVLTFPALRPHAFSPGLAR